MDREIEELSLAAWPAIQTILYDGWVLRFADGYTKRSNSVNPLYGSSLELDEKIAACEVLYGARGLPTIFKLSSGGEHDRIDRSLETRSYERLDETSVRILELGDAKEQCFDGLEIGNEFTGAWIDAYCACSKHGMERPIIEQLLENVISTKIVISKVSAGEIVGCGYGALDRGTVGIFDIVVRQDMRGRGFGEEIVRAILGRSARLGARRAYLQVVVGNSAAETLYEKLGFREIYRYWYRRR